VKRVGRDLLAGADHQASLAGAGREGEPDGPWVAPPAFDEQSPIIAFKRFAIELRYWPLLRKTIQLRGIELESARLALDRLANGHLNVLALVPQREVTVEAGASHVAVASPTPASEGSSEGSG